MKGVFAMLTNYHIHNVMCGHAEGLIEEYTQAAVDRGLKEIGHSDHFPFPWDALNDGRMKYDQLPEYFRQIEESRQKHKSEIKVYTGGEIEYISDFDSYYDRLLSTGKCDYFILGQHFYSPDGFLYQNVYVDFKGENPPLMDYARTAIDGLKKGFFLYWAHPDLFFLNDIPVDDSVKKVIDYILNECVKNDFVLELNCGGYRSVKDFEKSGRRSQYGAGYFWEELAKTNIRCIIGSDAHHPNAVFCETNEELTAYAKKLGLNLVDHLPIK